VASLSIDNMQKEAHRRESSQDKKTTALTQRPSQLDYAKVAKQVREWSFRFDGAEKPFEFLEQVEWPANTYGLDHGMIPRAMPELLKGEALKWFIARHKNQFVTSGAQCDCPNSENSTIKMGKKWIYRLKKED